jgi:transposase
MTNERVSIVLTEEERQELKRIEGERGDNEKRTRARIVLKAANHPTLKLADIARGLSNKRHASKVLHRFARDRIDAVNGKPKGRPKGRLNGHISDVEVMAEIALLLDNEPEATLDRFKEHLNDHFGRSFGASTVRRYVAEARIRFRIPKT